MEEGRCFSQEIAKSTMKATKNPSEQKREILFKTKRDGVVYRMPIYFSTSKEAVVVISLDPTRSCKFAHN